MEYVFVFLEGILTFLSPCILPLIPIYLGYMVGAIVVSDVSRKDVFEQALYFVFGFTLIFVALGATSSLLGAYLITHLPLVKKIGGGLIILFGLSYILGIAIFKGSVKEVKISQMHWYKSLLFGIAFSVGFTPCAGPFLASALTKAVTSGEIREGMILLAIYSIGLGIPFLLSALLIKELKGFFDVIKRHSRLISILSGLLLVSVGLLMIFNIF